MVEWIVIAAGYVAALVVFRWLGGFGSAGEGSPGVGQLADEQPRRLRREQLAGAADRPSDQRRTLRA